MSGKAKREAMSDASARIIGELTSSWRVNNQIRTAPGRSKTQKVNPAVVPTCVGLLEGSRSDPPCRRLVQNLERSIIVTASKATPQEFHDNHYRDAHEEYIWWLRYNPRGFVMNLETTKRAFLHESDCMHIADYSDRDVRLTDKRKVCASSTSAPLKLWASKCGIK